MGVDTATQSLTALTCQETGNIKRRIGKKLGADLNEEPVLVRVQRDLTESRVRHTDRTGLGNDRRSRICGHAGDLDRFARSRVDRKSAGSHHRRRRPQELVHLRIHRRGDSVTTIGRSANIQIAELDRTTLTSDQLTQLFTLNVSRRAVLAAVARRQVAGELCTCLIGLSGPLQERQTGTSRIQRSINGGVEALFELTFLGREFTAIGSVIHGLELFGGVAVLFKGSRHGCMGKHLDTPRVERVRGVEWQAGSTCTPIPPDDRQRCLVGGLVRSGRG